MESSTPASGKGRVAISGEDLPNASFAPTFCSPAVTAGGWLFCSGTMSTDFDVPVSADGFTDPEALYRPGAWDYNRLATQSHGTMRRLRAIFEAAGGDLRTDTVRIEQFFRSPHPTQEDFDTTPRHLGQGHLDHPLPGRPQRVHRRGPGRRRSASASPIW